MSGCVEKKPFVFRVRVADRAGALTSIASSFSNRGISVDTVVGHSHYLTNSDEGTVVVTFRCTEEEKDTIARVLRRLSKVTSLTEHPYECKSLRKSAVVHVSRRLTPGDVVGKQMFLTCEPIQQSENEGIYFLAGPAAELDPIVERFIKDGILKDVVYSVLHL
jgi:hypothetical protein